MNDDANGQQHIIELQIQVALQEEMLQSLSQTVARLQQSLDLQQAQLRLIYQKLPDQDTGGEILSSTNEKPPHY